MSRLIRNIRYPSPECHCVSVDSHYRMQFIVALLEGYRSAPWCGAVTHALATSSAAALQQGILVFGLSKVVTALLAFGKSCG
jgi:hypothetical protein